MYKKRLLVLFFSIIFLSSLVFAFSLGRFTVDQINVCGDNIVDGSEECDLQNLSLQTCISKGYDSGVLSCSSECTFDESQCTSLPITGDGSGRSGGAFITKRQCNDNIDNDLDGFIDGDDPGCSNFLDDSELEIICDSDWEIGEWGECIESLQIRRSVDINHCRPDYIQNEQQECLPVLQEKNFPTFVTSGLILAVIIIFIIFIWIKKKNENKPLKKVSKKTQDKQKVSEKSNKKKNK